MMRQNSLVIHVNEKRNLLLMNNQNHCFNGWLTKNGLLSSLNITEEFFFDKFLVRFCIFRLNRTAYLICLDSMKQIDLTICTNDHYLVFDYSQKNIDHLSYLEELPRWF